MIDIIARYQRLRYGIARKDIDARVALDSKSRRASRQLLRVKAIRRLRPDLSLHRAIAIEQRLYGRK